MTKRGEHVLLAVMFALAAFAGYLTGWRDARDV